MAALGYEKYVAQGGDWGSIIVRIIALDYPERCVAAHVNMLVAMPPSFLRTPLTAAYFWGWAPFQGAGTKLGRMLWWNTEENGYFEIQGSKPMTLSYGLVDSPVGMMAWIRDKLQPLIDERDFSWSEEEVITWAMLYIIPGTSGHANIYKNCKGKRLPLFKEYFLNRVITDQVDFGVSVFPYDCYNIPKWWADASVASNIVFWKEHERGGHFAAMEKPAELVADIREFTSLFKAGKLAELRESGKLKK
ncbi:Alpha/Beta hydrolase protein [Bisporella sp. PMI_857]|nr:Alpha/Beta hydrolase protein [Bisporella sp. PMI_857]